MSSDSSSSSSSSEKKKWDGFSPPNFFNPVSRNTFFFALRLWVGNLRLGHIGAWKRLLLLQKKGEGTESLILLHDLEKGKQSNGFEWETSRKTRLYNNTQFNCDMYCSIRQKKKIQVRMVCARRVTYLSCKMLCNSWNKLLLRQPSKLYPN